MDPTDPASLTAPLCSRCYICGCIFRSPFPNEPLLNSRSRLMFHCRWMHGLFWNEYLEKVR